MGDAPARSTQAIGRSPAPLTARHTIGQRRPSVGAPRFVRLSYTVAPRSRANWAIGASLRKGLCAEYCAVVVWSLSEP